MDANIKRYNQLLTKLKKFSLETFPAEDVNQLFNAKHFSLPNNGLTQTEKADAAKQMLGELEQLDKEIANDEIKGDSLRNWKSAVAKRADACIRFKEAPPDISKFKSFATEGLIAELKKITKEYTKAHKKANKNKPRLFMPTLANDDLRREKHHVFTSLLHTLTQKEASIDKIQNDFLVRLYEIHNDPITDMHRDPTWKRYLKNIAGVLCFGIAPIYSKYNSGTFCFWRTESRRIADKLGDTVRLRR